MSLSLLRLLIALCCFPVGFSRGGFADLTTELTPSLSCCAVSTSRWEAVASVAAMMSSVEISLGVMASVAAMMSSVGISLGVTV